MDKIDIKQINAYLDNVEADLVEQELDNTGMTMQNHELYKIIENLMDVIVEEKDHDRKMLYVLLQYKARNLYTHIDLQLGARN